MAVKNIEMDETLKKSAMKEFLQYGFRDASLRRIADSAGTTTGSIYTRYDGKDGLFLGLTTQIRDAAMLAFEQLRPVYEAAGDIDGMMDASRMEARLILEIVFRHYDEAVLLICKSEGSSANQFWDQVIERKVRESESFFGDFAGAPDLKHAFEVLLTMQFEMYRKIIQNGYTREEALQCMDLMMVFMNGGWKALMEALWRLKEKSHERT
ncbi:MAG: TetR/AcrR family transcriptional regulator [Lachnospiraceae bacterium]|nr:TetR/AcrR family transcriptional regulator [Lachnospiraceae bacterium]